MSFKGHILGPKSYQESYKEALDFLKFLMDSKYEEASSLASKATSNKMVFASVLKDFQAINKLKKENQKLSDKMKLTQQKNNQLTQQNRQLRKGSKPLQENQSDYDEYSSKVRLLYELESNNIDEAFRIASEMKNFRWAEIVQMHVEYQWLIGTWMGENRVNNFVSKNQKGFAFGAQRAFMKKLAQTDFSIKDAMNTVLNDTLGNILDSAKDLKIDESLFWPKVRAQLQSILFSFQETKRENVLVAEQQSKIVHQISKQIPDLMKQLQTRSFYNVLNKFIENKYDATHKGSQRQDKTSKYSKQVKNSQQDDLDTVVPMSLGSARSESIRGGAKLSELEMSKVVLKIAEIDEELKMGDNRFAGRHQNKILNVLDDALTAIKKDHYYRQLQDNITSEKEVQIKAIKSLNKQLLEMCIIEDPFDLQDGPYHSNSIMQKMISNIGKAVQAIKRIQPFPESSLPLLKMPIVGEVNRYSIVQNEASCFQLEGPSEVDIDEDDCDGENHLKSMKKSELIETVQELRENIKKENEKRVSFLENYEIIQSKYLKVERQLKQSLIMMPRVTDDDNEEDMEELRLLVRKLKDEVSRISIERDQLRDKNIELFQSIKQFELSKQQYDERIRMLEEKNSRNDKRLSVNRKHSGSSNNLYRSFMQIKSEKADVAVIQEEDKTAWLVRINEGLSARIQQLSDKAQSPSRISLKTSQESGHMNPDNNMIGQSIVATVSKFQSGQKLKPTDNTDLHITQKTKKQEEPVQKASEGQELTKLQENINALETHLVELSETVTEQESIIEDKKLLIEQYADRIQCLERKCEDINAELEEAQRLSMITPAQAQFQQLFVLGSIFNDYAAEDRFYLIQTLTNFLGPIKKTHLLYRYDPLNKVNPHRYVDSHKNIVLIARTIYGKYIAAFSAEEIFSTGCATGFGLMISIWNRMTFEILRKKRPVTYDDFFLIFGNSELRIRSQENKVFSNFGINNGFYNSRGHKVDSFLGEKTDRQVALDSYEVYRLELQKGF